MPSLNPYINFNGNAEEAFTFYQSVFGLDAIDEYFEELLVVVKSELVS